MALRRLLIAVLVFAVTEPALALCPDPPSFPGAKCCTYATGLSGGDNQEVSTMDQCLAIAQPFSDSIAASVGCAVPAFSIVTDPPVPPPGPGLGWVQSSYAYYVPPVAPPGNFSYCDTNTPYAYGILIYTFMYWNNTCPILPLEPYLPDPEPVDITAPNFKLGTQLACMQNAIRASNGTSRVNSGYRSAPYNKHLQQVWDKWLELLRADQPECAAELATAENHKNAHELVARPANSSAHTRGEAFDLSSGLYDGILDVLGFGCGLRRPDPISDPPHFIRR